MRYFGIPTCPYCKKRVNLIRTWSLKRQGEYQCPRCSGISNIYLSPLIYVLGLLAVFAGGSMYFFHKFVLDDVTLETALYVFVPFAVFFLFSLFMVYLEKPVIKKISREEYKKKRRFRKAAENLPNASSLPSEKEYYDSEDYIPSGPYAPGPQPQGSQADELAASGVVNQAAFRRARQQAAMENVQVSQRVVVQKEAPRPAQGQSVQPRPQERPLQQRPAVQRQQVQRPAVQAQRTQVQRPQAGGVQNTAVQRPAVQNAAHNPTANTAAPIYTPNPSQIPQNRPANVQNIQGQNRPAPQRVQNTQHIEPVPRRAVGQQSINRVQYGNNPQSRQGNDVRRG